MNTTFEPDLTATDGNPEPEPIRAQNEPKNPALPPEDYQLDN
jgi:hypothetical protein